METHVRIRRMPLVIIAVAVCLASVVVGWFFGGLAAIGYVLHGSTMLDLKVPSQQMRGVGPLAGVVGGLLAGLLWCCVIVRRVVRRRSDESLVLAGCIWGVLVGVLTTVEVHATLFWVARMVSWPVPRSDVRWFLGIGLVCGAVAGGLLGLASGAACGWVARRFCASQPSSSALSPASE